MIGLHMERTSFSAMTLVVTPSGVLGGSPINSLAVMPKSLTVSFSPNSLMGPTLDRMRVTPCATFMNASGPLETEEPTSLSTVCG